MLNIIDLYSSESWKSGNEEGLTLSRFKVNSSGYLPSCQGFFLMVRSCYYCTSDNSHKNSLSTYFHIQSIVMSSNFSFVRIAQVCPLLSLFNVNTLIQVTIIFFPIY